MKKLMIRIGLLLFAFAVVFACVYFYQNKKPAGEAVLMDEASLPVVYMLYEGERINRLHGYRMEMDAASMRDSLTPVRPDRELRISVDTYGKKLTGISYEVRSLDKERLIERTLLEEWTESKGAVDAVLKLENLIEAGEEYLLTLQLTVEEGDDILYYTRILTGVEQMEEKLAYVLDRKSVV